MASECEVELMTTTDDDEATAGKRRQRGRRDVWVNDDDDYGSGIARRKRGFGARRRERRERARRQRARRREAKARRPEAQPLTWLESACAVVIGSMGVRVARGQMTARTMSLRVLMMWVTSLVYTSIFRGMRMDQNTPPPDRLAVLFIKLAYALMKWAVVTVLSAPVWTVKGVYAGLAHRAVDVGWDDTVASTVPSTLADDIRDTVTNKDYEDFATAVANDEGEWDVIASGKVGCCTYRMLRGVSAEDKRMMKKGIAKFRTEVVASGVPVEVLFHAQTDLLGRQKWDPTTMHPTCIEREDPQNKKKPFTAQDAVYWRLKYPRLMAPRDYLVTRRMWYDPKSEMATCISRDALGSASAMKAKRKLQQMMGSKAVDVKSLYSAIMVGKNADVNGSQYVSVYYEDPGVPPRLAHVAAAKGLDGYMATFDRELQRRVKAGEKMKGFAAIPSPPTTRENVETTQFATGRTSVPQSDNEGESETPEVPVSPRGTAEPHFAPTDVSREYRFSGRDGLGKRQRIKRRIKKLVNLVSELADPNSVSRRSQEAEEASAQEEDQGRVRGRKRRWAKRIVFGALVWIGRIQE